MRFHAEHRLPGPPDAVAGLLVDPLFYAGLSLPDLSLPEVIEHGSDTDGSWLSLRYEFLGGLDPLARRLVGSRRLVWRQDMRVASSARSGALEFRAEADPGRLHGSASFVLTPEGVTTLRRLDGELVVSLPGIGRLAEGRIVPGLLRRLDLEAEALEAQLAHGDR